MKEKILINYKNVKSDYYDCLIHLDGSRESIAALHDLKLIQKMKPLGVTFNHFNYDNQSKFNIRKCLEIYDINHLMFSPRLSIIKKIEELDIELLNDLIIQGIYTFLFKTAKRYNIDLCVSTLNKETIINFETDSYFFKIKNIISKLHVTKVSTLFKKQLTKFDLLPYTLPIDEIKNLDLGILFPMNDIDTDYSEIFNYIDKNFYFDSSSNMDNGELFWLGFTDDWSFDKNKSVRSITKYEKMAQTSIPDQPLYYGKLKYCTRCCMPETSEALLFDELGMCQPCASSEQKMHINWDKRKEKLEEILEKYSSDDNYYDCMVPISGGKDSTFQLHILKNIYNKKILSSTFNANWMTKTGRKNLMNAIIKFDVDHINFTPRRKVINKLAKKSLGLIGDACWHCHAGVGSFPLQAAVDYNIKLLIWGESVSENDGRATYNNPINFDRDYFTKFSARFYAEEMIDSNISAYDILPYKLPAEKKITKNNIIGIHLGDYMFWDDERQMEFVRDHYEWEENNVEGSYKGYKSVECMMEGVHEYSNFVKRGYGKGTYHASEDVRKGLLLRNEGFELGKIYDTERPDVLDYYLQITGYTEEQFYEILKKVRDNSARVLNKYDPPKI